MAGGKIGISTHVLDTGRGMPAKEVAVRLQQQEKPDQWREIASARTDGNGRCLELVPPGQELAPGIYQLVFDTGSYFRAQGVEGLYPVVQVTFQVNDRETHYHLPLLLSPHGYTTYRGT
jgi:5-hydroxyisourate hydrolase